MQSDKVKLFIKLAGQKTAQQFEAGSPETRRLGAQLLLSEVLEYIIKGLGVTPVVNGQAITEPEKLEYRNTMEANKLEMLDGLADVAYTMYWNALAFGIPLEEGFDLVCDNNLDKFIKLDKSVGIVGDLEPANWHCGKNVNWPKEVVRVEIVNTSSGFYAVGKDINGKVRKPSTYKSVDLQSLLIS